MSNPYTPENAIQTRSHHQPLFYKNAFGQARNIVGNPNFIDICQEWDKILEQQKELDDKVKRLDEKLEKITNLSISKIIDERYEIDDS